MASNGSKSSLDGSENLLARRILRIWQYLQQSQSHKSFPAQHCTSDRSLPELLWQLMAGKVPFVVVAATAAISAASYHRPASFHRYFQEMQI